MLTLTSLLLAAQTALAIPALGKSSQMLRALTRLSTGPAAQELCWLSAEVLEDWVSNSAASYLFFSNWAPNGLVV